VTSENAVVAPGLHAEITNRSTVERLYRDVRSLPTFPHTPMHCPSDFGPSYHLGFFRGAAQLLGAAVDATGCQIVKLSNGVTLWSARPRGRAFLAQLADALHLAPSEFRAAPGNS
jgi:hypothetical protein